MNHFTIVTARGQQHFTADGKFISGENVQSSARTATGARLAVFTLAGEADARIVKGLRWVASMIFYMLHITNPSPAASAVVADFRLAVYAVSSKPAETIVKLPTTAHGEYYSSKGLSLSTAIDRFTAKYGVKPTLIEINAIEEKRFYGCECPGLNNKYRGIAVEFVDAVPEDTYYLNYSPKAAWRRKMDAWLAAHPNPQTKPAPQPQRFQPAGPQVNSLSA